MSVGTTAAIGIAAGVGAAGSLGAGIIGANAAGNAASAQAQQEQNALDFQKQVYANSQQNEKPFIQAGQNAVTSLDQLMGLPPLNQNAPSTIPQSIGGGKIPFPMIPRAAGGPVGQEQRYLVGEKGPEELIMHSGSGTVVPAGKFNLNGMMQPRAFGGPVGHYGTPYTDPTSTPTLPSSGIAGTSGQRPATQPTLPQTPQPAASPFGDQANNPLVTGGSPNPVQQTPFTQWTQQFQAPTLQQAMQEPGYQFQLQQGENAILNNASALGTTGSGATGAALEQYGQGLAQTDYQNVYNRALQQYQQNYNIFNQNQGNQFNRLSALMGGGQTAIGQLNNAGAQAGQQVGQTYGNIGSALGSGYVGAGNAYGGALGNLGNLGQYALLAQFMRPQSTYQNPSTFGQNSYGLGQS